MRMPRSAQSSSRVLASSVMAAFSLFLSRRELPKNALHDKRCGGSPIGVLVIALALAGLLEAKLAVKAKSSDIAVVDFQEHALAAAKACFAYSGLHQTPAEA